jgi:phosphoglycerate dehydrogenase-like enzyme
MTTICLPTSLARDAVGELPDGIDILLWDGSGEPPPEAAGVDLLVAQYSAQPWDAAALARMPRLRAIQVMSAGVEAWLPRVPAGVVLCNGRGIHTGSTAELAVAGMLSLLRELPRFALDRASQRWEHVSTDGLDGKRVLIIGAGDIGRRIAAAVEVFDATVTLVARRARDGVHAIDELALLVPQHQIVVVAVPMTAETKGLVDAQFLTAMPDGAMLVNIARGPIVDTDALLAELATGRLSAFLDVTDPEPPPPGHPLWSAPNLLLTPHVGGGTRGWERRSYRLVREQILRLHRGEPLINVVGESY